MKCRDSGIAIFHRNIRFNRTADLFAVNQFDQPLDEEPGNVCR